MPIYEYECLAQAHRFEELQKIGEPPLRKCRVCGGKVKKLISQTSFQLKGGGWYKDGYATSGNGNGNGKKPGAERPLVPKSSPASEAKPKGTSTSNDKQPSKP